MKLLILILSFFYCFSVDFTDYIEDLFVEYESGSVKLSSPSTSSDVFYQVKTIDSSCSGRKCELSSTETNVISRDKWWIGQTSVKVVDLSVSVSCAPHFTVESVSTSGISVGVSDVELYFDQIIEYSGTIDNVVNTYNLNSETWTDFEEKTIKTDEDGTIYQYYSSIKQSSSIPFDIELWVYASTTEIATNKTIVLVPDCMKATIKISNKSPTTATNGFAIGVYVRDEGVSVFKSGSIVQIKTTGEERPFEITDTQDVLDIGNSFFSWKTKAQGTNGEILVTKEEADNVETPNICGNSEEFRRLWYLFPNTGDDDFITWDPAIGNISGTSTIKIGFALVALIALFLSL